MTPLEALALKHRAWTVSIRPDDGTSERWWIYVNGRQAAGPFTLGQAERCRAGKMRVRVDFDAADLPPDSHSLTREQ